MNLRPYRLQFSFNPHGFSIAKQVLSIPDDKSLSEVVEKYLANSAEERCLYNLNAVRFSEFSEPNSGLLIKESEIQYIDSTSYKNFVDTFEVRGRLFSGMGNDDPNRDLNHIEISDDGIRSFNYGPIGDIVYDNPAINFKFPVQEIFQFLYELGSEYIGGENNTVLTWPANIQKRFDELNIKTECYLDYEPDPIDLSKLSKSFQTKYGDAKVAKFGDTETYFMTPYGMFTLSLKVFHPDENDRLAYRFFP
jgi:hypothetical protein